MNHSGSAYCKTGSAAWGASLDVASLVFAGAGIGGIPAGLIYSLSIANGFVTLYICGHSVSNYRSLALSIGGKSNIVTGASLIVNLKSL